jgi:hypothetical protein
MFQKFIDKWNRQDEDTFHFRVSIAKSSLRIAAGLFLVFGSLALAGLALIAAEILGIVEEL